MFAHIAFCVQKYDYKKIVVQATDSDVFVLGMYCCPRIPGLSEFWIQKMDKYFSIHCIVEALARKSGVETPIITSVLLSIYILSGCDTVSFQYKKGKKIVLKIALEMVHKLYPLGQCAEPGEGLAVTENIIQAARLLF